MPQAQTYQHRHATHHHCQVGCEEPVLERSPVLGRLPAKNELRMLANCAGAVDGGGRAQESNANGSRGCLAARPQ